MRCVLCVARSYPIPSFLFRIFLISLLSVITADDYPWTYDNDLFGGPEFWGLLDKRWQMCNKGKLQSPINIDPSSLLYDPNMAPIHIDKAPVLSELINFGQMPRVKVANTGRWPSVNVTGGPLEPYRYRLQRIDIHFGRGGKAGSEHAIDSKKFHMEIQMIAFNSDLYKNFTSAVASPHGIAALSLLVQIGNKTNEELQKLSAATANIPFKKKRVELVELKPWRMVPHKADYVTYEGSMTSPGCHETVTWIIVNHPLYIAKEDLDAWGLLQQSASSECEPRFVAPNCRALQEPNGRIVRTNIRHRFKDKDEECKKHLNESWYRVNANRTTVHGKHVGAHRIRHSVTHSEQRRFF